MNNTIFVLIIIFIFLSLYYLSQPKKEDFFYWNETPNYVKKSFDLNSCLFMSELASLKTFVDVEQFLDKYNFPKGEKYFIRDKNIVHMHDSNVSYIWLVSTQNKDIYISFDLNDSNEELDKDSTIENNLLVQFPYIASGFEGVLSSKRITQKWASIREYIFNILSYYQPENVYLTGLGEGGSIASMAAFDLKMNKTHTFDDSFNPIIYSFDSPAIGNIGFVTYYNKVVQNSYRMITYLDEVDKYMIKEEKKRTFEVDNDHLFHVDKRMILTPMNKNLKNLIEIIRDMILNNIECLSKPFEDKSNVYMGYRNISRYFPARKNTNAIWI